MQPKTRAQVLAEEIEQTITQRGLKHGAPLGTIDDWRDQSGFGRSTVSEAIRLMIDRGSVEIRPGRGGGIFVTTPTPVVRLRHTLLTVHGEPGTVQDAIRIRDGLEPLVDIDAAEQRTDTDIADLRRLLEHLGEAVDDTDRFMRANWALHQRIAAITSNRLLGAIYTSLTEAIADLAEHADAEPSATTDERARLAHRLAVHTELVDGIIAGDADAITRALVEHQR